MSQQQLPDVAPAEDPGGGFVPMPAHSIMAAVMELQSLVEWTAQRKGIKEDASVVNEKLRQLDKIRKELEKSARLGHVPTSITETSHTPSSSDDIQKNEISFPTRDSLTKDALDSSDKITAPLICDQDTSYHQPVQDLTKDVHAYSTRAMDDSFHLEDVPLPTDECNCDSSLEENNVDLYINFVSAKEKIEKLTMDLEDEVKSPDKVDSRHHGTDEPDSLGTAISEDEGLGEESRRADSTGSNSFLDIHTSEEDLVDSSAGTSSIHYVKEVEPSTKTDVVWINDPQDPRLSVELCRCTIYKLKECLKAKEEQLKRIRDEYRDNNQVKSLQTLVNNLKNEMEEMKSQLDAAHREKSELKEQILELEEAENDSRRQCQRYEEKVLFLQEKDSHFQAEFVETKQTLEMAMSTLTAKDAKEKELRSQMKYMEVLVQKYEDQMKALEMSESKLKQKIAELQEELSKLQNSKPDVLHKGTQTYSERKKPSFSDCCPTPGGSCDEKHCTGTRDEINHSKLGCSKSTEQNDIQCSSREDASSRKSSIKSIPDFDECAISQFTEIGIQVNLIGCTTENTAQTDLDVQMCCESDPPTEEVKVQSSNSSVTSVVVCQNTSKAELDTTLGTSCPFQQELFRRLHHLVEEDAHLQQQLHHMDQINLTLWQKLHNLEFHIGECKKENFQHNARMDEEARSSETTSPVNIPLRDCNSSHSITGKSQTLDAGEEEHFVSSGKIMSLDFNEDGLKDRLLRLEQINSTFEAELGNREKLYQMKEQKHKEWMEAEDRFTCDIQYLQMEKNTLLAKVTQLEVEKQRLTDKLHSMVEELSALQEHHSTQISLMTEEHEALVSELRNRIELLTKKEKEYVGQIANLRMEKKSARKEIPGEKSELENLKASYVQLQIELSHDRSNMRKMENDFEDRLETLRQNHLIEEARLEEELRHLREKETDFNEQLITYQKRQSELTTALSNKEKQLENTRLEFKQQLYAMEEEHRTVETELNRKLRQMEESTAVATKALTEEKVRLEKELQENLYDLRTKEEQYKSRIAELESNVSQLHVELRRLTGDLDAGFPECEGTEFPPFQKERLQKQLQELQRREGDLREKLDEMEQKEAAYRETLENADRIVASVERGYKNKIEELEMSERSLKQRVNHLEEIESKLRVALHRERRSSDGRKPDDLVLELLEAEVRENTLKERIETLEQSQRTTTHRIKELEKMRESLESKMVDHNEMVTSLGRLQQEHDLSRKEIAKLRISESGLKLALQQAEGMLKSRETEIRNEMQRMQEEKKDLEETIQQLRMQVRQLQMLMDCSQEEQAGGETLSESVHDSESPEIKEAEALQSPESMQRSSPAEEDQSMTEEGDMISERTRTVTFQDSCKNLLDESIPDADIFLAESERSSIGAGDITPLSGDSLEIFDEYDEPTPPTVEFFLPEPKKLQYEIKETNIPEMQPLQECINPLVDTDSHGSTKTEATESEARTADSQSNEQLAQPEEKVPEDTKVEASIQKEEVTPVESKPSKPHSESKVSKASVDCTESAEGIADEPLVTADDSEKLSTNAECPASESAESTIEQKTDSQVPDASDESPVDKEIDCSAPTCGIQLQNEELLVNEGAELSSEGTAAVPADSILKLLRGLRPGSTAAIGHYAQTGVKPKTTTKQNTVPNDVTAETNPPDGEKKSFPDVDQVDWLKVAEESASRYAEEKKALEEEVQRLREEAAAIEKDKKILQESLKKVEDLENLRDTNLKLQEEVSLLQKRLKMSTLPDSAETKNQEEKCLKRESFNKQTEEKKEVKTDQTSKQESVVPPGTSATSSEVKPLNTSSHSVSSPPRSPPPPPPVDECRKERQQMEEDMIRAMVAMQFDMQQKKAAQKFNPVYSGNDDTSTRPKVPAPKEEVVAMGACCSEAMEDQRCAGGVRSSDEETTVHSPYNFRVVQQVGSDTVLVGWEHAHPTELEGFEVYVNGTLHETVYTPDRTKAVISGLDLQQQLTLSVCAISRFGDVSEPRLLHLPQRDNNNSKDGFFFLDEDEDDYDDLFYVDEDIEKNSRPYSMEW